MTRSIEMRRCGIMIRKHPIEKKLHYNIVLFIEIANYYLLNIRNNKEIRPLVDYMTSKVYSIQQVSHFNGFRLFNTSIYM